MTEKGAKIKEALMVAVISTNTVLQRMKADMERLQKPYAIL